MFYGTDEDDLDFSPAAGSKLATLFNLENSPSKGNPSLTYTAPKQPKSHSAAEDGHSHEGQRSNKLSLIFAKEVHAFKLKSGAYVPHGKSGAALVGNDSSRTFRLLLYQGKQQIFSTAVISPAFQYTVLPSLYASFNDNVSQNWSIVFEKKEDSMDFARKIGVIRYKAYGPNEAAPLCQELFPGSGKGFKDGDTAFLSVKASVLPTLVSQIGSMEMKASFNHKLSVNDWSAGLVGASPGSCRLLVLPKGVEIPWMSMDKSHSMLIEALVQSKKGELGIATTSSSSSLNEPSKCAPTSGAESATESGCEDSSIRARGASIKEALTHSPRSSKASIISRMARMGQATLPLEGAAVCNPSDSEETEEESRLHESKRPPLKGRTNKVRPVTVASRQLQPSPLVSNSVVSPHVAPTTSSISSAMTIVPAPSMHRAGADGTVLQYLEGQLVSLNTQSNNVSPSEPSPHMSMFLSEARIHNTEMRMHLSKFGDKMDQLLTKVDSLQLSPASIASSPALEPNVLLSSIEKLVKDNQTLHNEVAEKNKRLDEQNERIFSLLSTNSKFLEQSNSLFEQKQQQLMQENQLQQNEELSLLVKQLENDKDSLGKKILSLQTQLSNVQGLVQSLQTCNGDLTQELDKIKGQLHEREESIMTQNTSSQHAEITSLREALQEQKNMVSVLQQQYEDVKTELGNQCERNISLEKENLEKVQVLHSQLKEERLNCTDSAEKATKLGALCIELEKRLKIQSQAATKNPNNTLSLSLMEFVSEVKLLMNTLYRGLSQQFVVGQNYEGGFVKSCIASTIKGETLNFVQDLESRQSAHSRDRILEEPKLEGDSDHHSVEKLSNAGAERNSMRTFGDEVNLSTSEPSTDSNSKLESSSTSTVSSAEPDLPPIPCVKNASGSNDSNLSSRQDREHSPLRSWGPHPPPLPLFNDDDEDDEWGP